MDTESVINLDKTGWQNVASSVMSNSNTGLFIDGDYVNAIEGGKFESINPANGETVAAVAAGTQADVNRAVEGAKKAFKGGAWSRMAPREASLVPKASTLLRCVSPGLLVNIATWIFPPAFTTLSAKGVCSAIAVTSTAVRMNVGTS